MSAVISVCHDICLVLLTVLVIILSIERTDTPNLYINYRNTQLGHEPITLHVMGCESHSVSVPRPVESEKFAASEINRKHLGYSQCFQFNYKANMFPYRCMESIIRAL